MQSKNYTKIMIGFIMKRIINICFFICLLNISIHGFAGDSPDKYLKKAKGFLKDYRFEPAFEMGNLALITAESSLPANKQIDYHIFSGKIFLLQEKYLEAKEVFEKSLKIIEENTVKKANKKKCNLKNYLAITLMKMKKYDLAVLQLKETIELYKSAYKGRNLTISVPVINLAETYKLKGDLFNAEDRYLEAKRLRSAERSNSDAQLLIKSGLASVYAAMGKKGEAKVLLADISVDKLEDSSVAVDIYDNIAGAYGKCSDSTNEKKYLEKAATVASKVFPKGHSRNSN